VRLRNAGYQLLQGPGPLVQVLRINTTRGPFKNAKYRQAFNYLIDRAAILRVGYAGLGTVTALPWAPASPAADKSYDTTYAFNLEKGQALLKESGLSAAEMSDWKLLVNGNDQDAMAISQIVQSTLARVGVNVQLEVKQGAEWTEALLGGKFDATFGGIGNIQKFPSRIGTNSIYRTANNPVLGEPHPHPAYVEAIRRGGLRQPQQGDHRVRIRDLDQHLRHRPDRRGEERRRLHARHRQHADRAHDRVHILSELEAAAAALPGRRRVHFRGRRFGRRATP
jgi:peptide/nickel transport system substrate-binding protein